MIRTFLALAAGLSALVSLGPAPAARGPGAILAMHRKLFAALDKGDAEAAASFLKKSGFFRTELFLCDERGRQVKARGIEPSRSLVAEWAERRRVEGGTWATKILESNPDCHSPELGYMTMEFEVLHDKDGRRTRKRFRSTSLVTYADGAWSLFHWHVSPVLDRDSGRTRESR